MEGAEGGRKVVTEVCTGCAIDDLSKKPLSCVTILLFEASTSPSCLLSYPLEPFHNINPTILFYPPKIKKEGNASQGPLQNKKKMKIFMYEAERKNMVNSVYPKIYIWKGMTLLLSKTKRRECL